MSQPHFRGAPNHGLLRFGDLLKGREDSLLRPLVALVARELGRQRGRPVPLSDVSRWAASTKVDEDGVGVDSLARLELVATINRTFELHRTGVEDYLLVNQTLGEWCEIIAAGFQHLPVKEPERVTFETSGSTGQPKSVVHDVDHMIEEISRHRQTFGQVPRVVSLVPPHHIYGFLFTVLSPLVNDWALTDLSGKGPGALAREAQTGDLIVGTPFTWDLVLKAGASLKAMCTGVTSTAPAQTRQWQALREIGVERLVEVYGSTETLGVGLREAAGEPFEFLPHLQPNGRTEGTIAHAIESGRPIVSPDILEFVGPREFRVEARRDAAVQVGGVNVFIDHVRKTLRSAPGVADAAVRLSGEATSTRLKAFIVPDDAADLMRPENLENSIRDFANKNLSDPERPIAIRIGRDLPTDAQGKLMDWAV